MPHLPGPCRLTDDVRREPLDNVGNEDQITGKPEPEPKEIVVDRALHVAIASFHKIEYLVTWNFGHLANVRRQARIKLFNTAAGFYVPMIVTPEFLVSEATEKVS